MTDSQAATKILLQEALALARAGDKVAARKQVRRATMLDPTNEVGWLFQAGLAENAQEAYQALERVQALNPTHPQLEKAQAWVKCTWPVEPKSPEKVTSRRKAFSLKLATSIASVGLVLGLGLLIAAFNFSEVAATQLMTAIVATPTQTPAQKLAQLRQAVDQASAVGNRLAMMNGLEQMRALAPDNPQIATQLAQLYYQQGLDWRKVNRLDQAQQSFERTLSVKPDFDAATQEYQLAKRFLAGVEHYQKAEWAKAVAEFEQVYQQNPAYLYVDEILYSAYYNLGVFQESTGQLASALGSYQQAIKILPDVPEATLKAKAVSLKLNPPTPTPASEPVLKKRIVVDISDQRAYVYENNELIHEFIVSTGEPGSDTAIGEFEVQSKIPMAYASTWNLDMPYWLGIYWAGPLENGFHALPTVRHTGYTLWDGYLGQRVSYGCIILSLDDAKTLYDWAALGTAVSIRP
ncbi:MAG: hypothetical protein DPW09_08395 [Anaerolineae bacterium]|nr:hypothetical protein [Anaerolineae bacterium]